MHFDGSDYHNCPIAKADIILFPRMSFILCEEGVFLSSIVLN